MEVFCFYLDLLLFVIKIGKSKGITVKLGRSVKKKLLGSQIRSQFNESRHLYTLNDCRVDKVSTKPYKKNYLSKKNLRVIESDCMRKNW